MGTAGPGPEIVSNESDFQEVVRAVFAAMHGAPPYAWQERMALRLLRRDLPRRVRLPTGSGKSSIAILALVARAYEPSLPRRVWFVVDRQVVVHQASESARKFLELLNNAEEGVLADLRDRLKSIGGTDEPFLVSELRGGMPPEQAWRENLLAPQIIVSTVNQHGSRIMLRGYRSRARSRPVETAFAERDSLVILDEAHISSVYATTLRAAKVRLDAEPGAGTGPVNLEMLEMSATLEDSDFEDDGACPGLASLASVKKTVVKRVSKSKFEQDPVRVVDQLEATRVIVVCNTVRDALTVYDKLRRQRQNTTHLLTGRMRGIDKTQKLKDVQAVFGDAEPTERHVLVATQAIEVGADFTCNAMVSYAAPSDIMAQRCGRLARRAGDGPGKLVIVTGATWYDKLSKDKQPAAATIKLLPVAADVSTSAWQSDKWALETRMPRPRAPVMLPSDWEVLELTNPEATWSPSPEAYLHGEREEEPRVAVAWRRDARDAIAGGLALYLEACPFVAAECAEVPLSEVRPWLEGLPDHLWTAVEGRRNIVPAVSGNQVGPQHTVLVDSAAGGLRDGTFDHGTRGVIEDVWETAYAAASGRRVIRIRYLLREEHRQNIRRMVERDNGFQPGSLALVELGNGQSRKGFWLAKAARGAEMSGDAEPPLLTEHAVAVEERVGRICGALAMPDDLTKSLCLAARHHDDGKHDIRFQAMLRGDDRLLAAVGRPIARSAPKHRNVRRPYPSGKRHEFASAAKLPHKADKLAVHLIMAHHGHARAGAIESDTEPSNPSTTFASAADLELVKAEQPQRFAELLAHHGGGLLRLLEAILVTADRQVAAEEDERWR